MKNYLLFYSLLFVTLCSRAQDNVSQYNIQWNTPSENAAGSMPCGGGDIGLNVWVEKGDLLFYMSRSGTFDENNQMLKLGRVRVHLNGMPISGKNFKQILKLQEGHISISTAQVKIVVWVDVFHPVIHVDMQTDLPSSAVVSYESWRYNDIVLNATALRANSYKVKQPFDVITYSDQIRFQQEGVYFCHRNRAEHFNVFDFTVLQQGLQQVKDSLYNPIKNNTFGGMLYSPQMASAETGDGKYLDLPYRSWKLISKAPVKKHAIYIALEVAQTNSQEEWDQQLKKTIKTITNTAVSDAQKTQSWWKDYWNRSFIYLEGRDSLLAQHYQLFRYMLGCNAYGKWPTKFNGGLFTFDPSQVVEKYASATPDFRLWGGGTMTAQNQRLVYFPMLRSGDFDMMKPQFDFYLKNLRNAELRSEIYWNHKGACFTEQLENFGLPNLFEYGLKRPPDMDPGMEHNAWLEYQWETVFEFCWLILEAERYNNENIRSYIPLIESCLRFYEEHYKMLAQKREEKEVDDQGHWVFYPSSAAETFKITRNSVTVLSALQSITSRLQELPDSLVSPIQKKKWKAYATHLPPIPTRSFNGYKTIAPAETWERVQNTETPQLYPLFPWGIYGIGRPDLEVAQNTYLYDTLAVKFKSAVGWRQHNIFAARLGFTEEALTLAREKFKPGPHRFPAFWGPGFDWTPDHNWGGTAMIGLQEMLLQTDGKKIYVLPACPKDWTGHFKLHAPYQTTVEAFVKDGKLTRLNVFPISRANDVILP